MIDEADEFVTGPQNKGKRPGESNNLPGGGPKRRRCMSPLLRLGRAYTPPVSPSASPRHSAGKMCIKTETPITTHLFSRLTYQLDFYFLWLEMCLTEIVSKGYGPTFLHSPSRWKWHLGEESKLFSFSFCICDHPADLDINDGSSEPDLIINHVNQNHYGSDGNSDSDADDPSSPSELQENHTAADPEVLRHRDEDENGQPGPGELPLGGEGRAEMVSMDEQVQHYLSPSALKKHIHTETTKVNNELRTLITKEIRKPGRRMYPNRLYWQGGQNKTQL